MKLTFAGTRGAIDSRARRHEMYATPDASCWKDRVRIDCGADGLGHIDRIKAAAIIVTHAHPDHGEGLKEGASCPVYATGDARATMAAYSIDEPRKVLPREPFRIGSIRFRQSRVQAGAGCINFQIKSMGGPLHITVRPTANRRKCQRPCIGGARELHERLTKKD